jgi:hypothetical protein
MRWVLLVAVSLLPFARVAQAQDPEQSWENLRTLRVGERIQVVDQRLKSQNGTFLSVSDDAITFQLEQNGGRDPAGRSSAPQFPGAPRPW